MSLVAAHSLVKQGVEIVGCDDIDFTVLSYSKYTKYNFVHASFNEDEEQYLQDMEEAIRRFAPPEGTPYVLMPMFEETSILSRHKERFEKLIKVAAPDWSSVSRVIPKHVLVDLAEETGASIPKTWQPDDLAAFDDLLDDLPIPCVIKPVAGVGGRGVKVCKSREDLEESYRKLAEGEEVMPLIQAAAPGRDYCMTGLFRDGEIEAHMAYTNLQSFPKDSGAGVMRETIDDALFVEEVRKLMKPTGWTGVAEIDFRWSGEEDDRPQLIEVNPRFWAGLFQSVESGIDYPWLLYQMTVAGEVPPHGEAEIGRKTRVPGFWAAEAFIEAFGEERDLSRVSAAWRKAKSQFSNHHYADSLKYLGAMFSEAVNLDDAAFILQQRFSEAGEASSELRLKDDPMISLGAFYILGSLIRHGHLPPEVKG